MINKLAGITANFINNNKATQKLFKKISENASNVSVRVANVVNVGIRPPLIMATTKPKNIMDGAYSSASSICSSISETITQNIVLKPFNKIVSKTTSKLSDSGFFDDIAKKVNTTPESSKTMVKSTLGRLVLIALVPLNGFIKGKILPPIAKKIGSVYKKDKVNVIG